MTKVPLRRNWNRKAKHRVAEGVAQQRKRMKFSGRSWDGAFGPTMSPRGGLLNGKCFSIDGYDEIRTKNGFGAVG